MIKICDYFVILVCDKLPSVLCRIMYKVMLDAESTASTVGFPSVLYIMHMIYLDPLIFVFVVFSM
jgi:hypothetical protein